MVNKFIFENLSHDLQMNLIDKIIKTLEPGRFIKINETRAGKQDEHEIMDKESVFRKVHNAFKDCSPCRIRVKDSLEKVRVKIEMFENNTGNGSDTHLTNKSLQKRRGKKAIKQNGTVKKRKSSGINNQNIIINKKRRRRSDVPEAEINRLSDAIPEYCRKNLKSGEAISKSYLYTNNESYDQQVINLSHKSSLDNVHVTTEQIIHFIEQMVCKGAIRRRNNPNYDKGWFKSETQRRVRMQVSIITCYWLRA